MKLLCGEWSHENGDFRLAKRCCKARPDSFSLGGIPTAKGLIGGFNVGANDFHINMKKNILTNTGRDFVSVGGKNPNVNVEKGKIVVLGA